MDDSLKALLSYVLEMVGRIERRPDDMRCRKCHTSWMDFRNSGKLGCATCYEDFRENIEVALSEIHSANRHTGKIPASQAHKYGDLLVKRELVENQRLLKQAIDAEEYEKAAIYRDKINQIMEQIAPSDNTKQKKEDGE